ncbi:hypothetical protein MY4038_004937 [Beauveria bassiana]
MAIGRPPPPRPAAKAADMAWKGDPKSTDDEGE